MERSAGQGEARARRRQAQREAALVGKEDQERRNTPDLRKPEGHTFSLKLPEDPSPAVPRCAPRGPVQFVAPCCGSRRSLRHRALPRAAAVPDSRCGDPPVLREEHPQSRTRLPAERALLDKPSKNMRCYQPPNCFWRCLRRLQNFLPLTDSLGALRIGRQLALVTMDVMRAVLPGLARLPSSPGVLLRSRTENASGCAFISPKTPSL